MAQVGFWEGMWRDLTGHGLLGGKVQIRLFFQPLTAFILGIRWGLRDGKRGRIPFIQSLFQGKGVGLQNLKEGLHRAIVPLCFGFLMDGILQHVLLGYVRPLAAVVVGTGLVFVPFVIGRELTNRIWRTSHGRRVLHAR